MPVWDRFWDISHPFLRGLYLHTSAPASQGFLPQLHSLDRDVREEFKNLDLHTLVAASQGSLPRSHSSDKDFREEIEDSNLHTSVPVWRDYPFLPYFSDISSDKDYAEELELSNLDVSKASLHSRLLYLLSE
jgi:hypothetical protein